MDLSTASLIAAEARVRAAGLPIPNFQHADVRPLPFADASFDHVFVCFVLEHLPNSELILAELCRVLRPGGSLTVIEGDHGSTLFHPDDPASRNAIDDKWSCNVERAVMQMSGVACIRCWSARDCDRWWYGRV